MPIFRPQIVPEALADRIRRLADNPGNSERNTKLGAAVQRLVSGGNGELSPFAAMQADEMAAQVASHAAQARKLNAEAAQTEETNRGRTDPLLADAFASRLSNLTDAEGKRMGGYLRGEMEEPGPADIDDAAAVGKEAQPYPMAPPNTSEVAKRAFAAAAAIPIANRMGSVMNGEQMVKAAGEAMGNLTSQRAQDLIVMGDPDRASALNQAAKPGQAIKVYDNMGNTGAVFAPGSGKVNANPDGNPLLAGTLAEARAKTANQHAQAALHSTQRRVAEGELQPGGKPPPGYAWGPKNAAGQPTLIAIEGGPAAPSAGAGAAGLSGDPFLQTMPKAKADQVKALAEGRMQFPAGFALKSPYWQDMLSSVAQYDPAFDAVNYNARAKTRGAFLAGKEGQSLNALNTVMGHFDSLEKAGTALDNTSFPLVNRAVNAIGGQVSPDLKGRLNAFNIARQAVSSEMERAYRGTGGNVTELEQWKKSLDSADSPQAMRAAIKEGVKLLSSKIDALGDQYNKGMGTTKQGLELLNPKARATYQRLLGDEGEQSYAGPERRSGKASSGIKFLGFEK
ncbi:MAG TPA: hypothetical protein VFB08_02160 [Burkholderiales bacterium]|nr:hypothetical protein [Burkholderiales bacterium]